GFMNEASAKWPETNVARPDGLTRVAIDAFTGMRAGPGSPSVDEWFIAGSEPHDQLAANTCGVDVLAVASVERNVPGWMQADRDWIRRAERGPGVAGGPDRTRTAFFYNNAFRPFGRSWGAVVVRTSKCAEPSASPSCYPIPTPGPSGLIPSFVIPSPSASGQVAALPCPTPSPLPSASPS